MSDRHCWMIRLENEQSDRNCALKVVEGDHQSNCLLVTLALSACGEDLRRRPLMRANAINYRESFIVVHALC